MAILKSSRAAIYASIFFFAKLSPGGVILLVVGGACGPLGGPLLAPQVGGRVVVAVRHAWYQSAHLLATPASLTLTSRRDADSQERETASPTPPPPTPKKGLFL